MASVDKDGGPEWLAKAAAAVAEEGDGGLEGVGGGLNLTYGDYYGDGNMSADGGMVSTVLLCRNLTSERYKKAFFLLTALTSAKSLHGKPNTCYEKNDAFLLVCN